MARRAALHSTPSRELVELAVRDNARFKDVVSEIERRAPDRAAFDAIVVARASGAMPPWLAAVLLGRARIDEGYAMVRQILVDAPGLLAESYAGAAMATLGGERAFDDLAALMLDAPRLVSREGAAEGLALLRRPTTASLLLRATRQGRIRRQTASYLVGDLPDAASTIAEWLGGDDALAEQMAIGAALAYLARVDAVLPPALAHAVEVTIRSGRVKQSPSTRQHLLERLQRAASKA